jgi:hypothetical protein
MPGFDKHSQTSLTIRRLPCGGYVVSTAGMDYAREDAFASDSIDKALSFVKDAITPTQPEPAVVDQETGEVKRAAPSETIRDHRSKRRFW